MAYSCPYVPLSDEPPATPLPPEDLPEQVIETNPVINPEEGDDLERIDDPRGISDHQDNLRSIFICVFQNFPLHFLMRSFAN